MKKIKINKKFILILGIVVAMTPFTVYGASQISKNYSYTPPKLEETAAKPQQSADVLSLRGKMNQAITNYDTLEVNYTQNDGATISKAYIVVDYKTNRALGKMVAENGSVEMEYLIRDRKSVQYNNTDNTFIEAPTLEEKRQQPSQRSFIMNGNRAVNFTSNPLPLPLGRAAIAIDPQQYSSGALMEDSIVTLKGEGTHLNRTVEIVDIQLSPVLSENSNSDQIELYVDKSSGVILKFTQFSGDKTIYELEATDFKTNHIVDQSLFMLNIPRNAERISDF
ncbi:MAG: hypothetical protein WDZ91_05255 [Paenibacillaceae bacterium]